MSLETDIQTAYEEQEAVETAARELEARIRRIDGAARLMPGRAYGKPIDRDAIAKSLTLRGLLPLPRRRTLPPSSSGSMSSQRRRHNSDTRQPSKYDPRTMT